MVSPAENSNILCERIEKLMGLDKYKLNEMGVNARDYYEKEFDREYLLKKLEFIFDS